MTRAEAVRAAAVVYAAAMDERDAMTPNEAAAAAWYAGHPYTRKEIADLITEQRNDARTQQDSHQVA